MLFVLMRPIWRSINCCSSVFQGAGFMRVHPFINLTQRKDRSALLSERLYHLLRCEEADDGESSCEDGGEDHQRSDRWCKDRDEDGREADGTRRCPFDEDKKVSTKDGGIGTSCG